jgi:hypothetical protein
MKTLSLALAFLIGGSAFAQMPTPLLADPSLIPPLSGCSPLDISLSVHPTEDPHTSSIQVKNLHPAVCSLSSGEMVSLGMSAGNLFFTGMNAQWSHRGKSGKILFHVGAELATNRLMSEVYSNTAKISTDIHIGRSGLFAGPVAAVYWMHNPLITGEADERYTGYGAEIGYQRQLSNRIRTDVTVGMTLTGPDRNIGLLEGRVGISWLIFKGR